MNIVVFILFKGSHNGDSKKIIGIALILGVSITSLAQKQADNNNLFKEDKETGEVKVIPLWKQSKMGLLFPYSVYKKVDLDEIEKWVKKLNKNGTIEYTYLRNVINDSFAIILLPKEKQLELASLAQNYHPLAQQDIPEFKDREVSLMQTEHFLSADILFRLPVNLSTNIKQTFGLRPSKALTNAAIEPGKPVDGKIAIQFFDDNSADPIGFYQGQMKNGLADGYGLFVKPYYNNNGKVIFTNRKDDERVIYYTRMGFWKEGAFVEENNAKAKMDSVLDSIGDFNKRYGVPAGVVPVRDLVYAAYLRDSLNKELTNACTYKFNVSWENKDHPSFLKRNVFFKQAYSDFADYSADALVIYVDPSTKKIEDESSEKPVLNFAAIRQAMIQAKWRNADTYLYDDYTLVTQTGWIDYNTDVCEYRVEDDPWNPGHELRTPVSWKNEAYNELKISYRPARNKEWIPAGDFTLLTERDCYGGATSWVEEGTSTFKHYSSSAKDGFINVISQVKEKFPDPTNDTTISSFQTFTNNKFNELLKRIAASARFRRDANDPLKGAWYDPKKYRIYLVDDLKSGTILCIENGNDDISNPEGYYKAIQKLQVKWMSDKNFRIAADGRFFDNDFSFVSSVRSRPSKTKYIHEDLQIQNVTADRIDFEENIFWTRLIKQ